MARLLNDWLTSYLEYAKNTESPTAYHIWSGISVLAAALERKCYFKWGHSTIYPNQYIILVGPSGEARKGEPLNIAREFIQYIGLMKASQSLTRESLIYAITEAGKMYQDATGALVVQSPMHILAPELSVLIGNKDIKFLADLTDWYDSHSTWTYETRARGKETITGVCVNILGATAPDWLPFILPQEAVGGGFTSRIVFVVEEQKGRILPDPNAFVLDKDLKAKLEDDLSEIHLLEGEYTFSPSALEAYKEWYVVQEEGIKKGRWPVADPKFHGYVSRRATHVKKLAMVLSASSHSKPVVVTEDFNRARVILEDAEKKMSRAFSGVGRVPFADLTEAVLSYVERRKSCLRSELLKQFYRDIDGFTLEKIERVLTYMKVIKITLLTAENDARYEAVTSAAERPPPPQVVVK